MMEALRGQEHLAIQVGVVDAPLGVLQLFRFLFALLEVLRIDFHVSDKLGLV